MFTATQIKGLTLSNRFVRSATWEGLAGDDGSCTASLTEMMTPLAAGGVGLIVASHAFVRIDACGIGGSRKNDCGGRGRCG